MSPSSTATQTITAFPAQVFCVETGVNRGDPLGTLDELVMDDIYELAPEAEPSRISLQLGHDTHFIIHHGSELGTGGARVCLDCALTLMPDRGAPVDAVVLVEVDDKGWIASVFIAPLSELMPKQGYRLVEASRTRAAERLAQMSGVSFARGTHVTLASGAQMPIEQLSIGDRLLTRDAGVQEVRWIGQTTVRAVGNMAPILIRAGALNNARDLLVSPEHRLMIYQRQDAFGTGQPEILVRARDLVNGDSVAVQDGGFVDYFQILFDRHHLIYAEGIAAESHFLDPLTQPALPDELRERLKADQSSTGRDSHGTEVRGPLLNRPDAVALLKRASLR